MKTHVNVQIEEMFGDTNGIGSANAIRTKYSKMNAGVLSLLKENFWDPTMKSIAKHDSDSTFLLA